MRDILDYVPPYIIQNLFLHKLCFLNIIRPKTIPLFTNYHVLKITLHSLLSITMIETKLVSATTSILIFTNSLKMASLIRMICQEILYDKSIPSNICYPMTLIIRVSFVAVIFAAYMFTKARLRV